MSPRRICWIPKRNTFLPADELRKRFDAVGAMDRQVINYCGGGIAASADALALIMLGHKDVQAVRRIAVGMGEGSDIADGNRLKASAHQVSGASRQNSPPPLAGGGWGRGVHSGARS